MTRVDKPLREEAAGARRHLWGKSVAGWFCGSDRRDGVGGAGGAGQQAVVPDAMEAVHCPAGDLAEPNLPRGGRTWIRNRQYELVRVEPHDLHALPGFDPVVLPAEGHAVGIGTDQAVVGDGDGVRVAAKIPEVLKFCCARSQNELRRECILFTAAARHEERPFGPSAAKS